MGMIFYCDQLSQKIKDNVKTALANMKGLRRPRIAIILVGDNPASRVYVNNKIKAFEYCDINYDLFEFDENSNLLEVIECILKLNKNDSVDAIMVQLPLPRKGDTTVVLDSILPRKDVDGLNCLNVGYLYTNSKGFRPCTAKGICNILVEMNNTKFDKSNSSLEDAVCGKYVTVIGRSQLVGSPVARMLQNAGATVTIAHRKTPDLVSACRNADILVVAAGEEGLINSSHVKTCAWVIDAGINRDKDGRLCGDVLTQDVLDAVEFVTPVPGGVGLMTVAELLDNIKTAYLKNCPKT